MFFDGSDVDESVLNSFGELPNGNYTAIITEIALKQKKDDPFVEYYSCEFEIVSGQFTGRKIWTIFTSQHHNEKAVQIGRAKLKGLCRVVAGKDVIQNENELTNKPLLITIKNKKDRQTGEMKPNVDDWKPLTTAQASQGAMSQAELASVF